LYGGKEYQDQLLGSSMLGLYDFHARYYNPLYGRWFNIDPALQSTNPYLYCGNSPMMYVDPDGEWFIFAVIAVIGGGVNLATNWDNVDGFWDGLSTFGIGALAALATFATKGSAGSLLAGGALVGANNDIVAQTGKNFDGFENIDWGQVGKTTVVSSIASRVGGATGGWAANSNFLVNGVNSPILRSVVGGVAGAAAGHVAGGTTYGLLEGQSLDDAFTDSFKGIGKSMVWGGAVSAVSTTAIYRANGINPFTGKQIHGSQNYTPVSLDPNGGDEVTLYRGMSGNENPNNSLFLTDDPNYAAQYAKQYGTEVYQVKVSRIALMQGMFDGSIQNSRGALMLNGNYGMEYKFSNFQHVNYIMRNMSKY
jgi:RHS repeat-associated protein